MTLSERDETELDDIPDGWEELSAEGETSCRWRSAQLGMGVEVEEMGDDCQLVGVLQDVAIDGFETQIRTYARTYKHPEDAIGEAHELMGEVEDGRYSVEPIRAFESEEMVDFVCLHGDELDLQADLDALREFIEIQLDDRNPEESGIDVFDERADARELSIEIYPKTKVDVEREDA